MISCSFWLRISHKVAIKLLSQDYNPLKVLLGLEKLELLSSFRRLSQASVPQWLVAGGFSSSPQGCSQPGIWLPPEQEIQDSWSQRYRSVREEEVGAQDRSCSLRPTLTQCESKLHKGVNMQNRYPWRPFWRLGTAVLNRRIKSILKYSSYPLSSLLTAFRARV